MHCVHQASISTRVCFTTISLGATLPGQAGYTLGFATYFYLRNSEEILKKQNTFYIGFVGCVVHSVAFQIRQLIKAENFRHSQFVINFHHFFVITFCSKVTKDCKFRMNTEQARVEGQKEYDSHIYIITLHDAASVIRFKLYETKSSAAFIMRRFNLRNSIDRDLRPHGTSYRRSTILFCQSFISSQNAENSDGCAV